MIAVTAATGKTGAPTSDLLAARGVPVVRWSSRPGRGDRRFDWNDRATWRPALEGVEALYLVKPPHGTDLAGLVAELLDVGRGLRRVVLLSEMARELAADGDPDRDVERVLEGWHGTWTILRPSWFFQNFSRGGGYRDGVESGHLPIATGDAPISWIDTRDVAEVAVVALTRPGLAGRALTLTGPESFGVDELARRLGAELGRPIEVAAVAAAEDLEARAGSGSDREVYLAGLTLDVLAGRFAAVTEDVPELLGRAPLTFDDFISEHRADWT